MFYDRFVQVCVKRGIAPSRAAVESGLSKSTVTKWKNDPNVEPSGSALKKLSDYFGVTIAELLDEDTAQKETPIGWEAEGSLEDMKLFRAIQSLPADRKEALLRLLGIE